MFEIIKNIFSNKKSKIKIEAYNNIHIDTIIELDSAIVDKFWCGKGSNTPTSIEFDYNNNHYKLGGAWNLIEVYKYWKKYDIVKFSVIIGIRNFRYDDYDKSFHGSIEFIKELENIIKI